MSKKTLRDVDLAGKRVLVRVDFNVPQNPDGSVADNTRIRETLPTIQQLRGAGSRIVLVSHLGRPDGKRDSALSLDPVARELAKLLDTPVVFARDTVGPDAHAKLDALDPGGVLLLENVRFHPEEEANDPDFGAELAKLGDIFVNDAFGTAHRAHASTAGVAQHLPAVAGLLMEKEIEALGSVLENPRRPLAAVIGGAKVSSKIAVLENLLPRVDALVIGGGMACTFLKAKGLEVGRSLLETDRVAFASELMDRAASTGVRFLLPVDGVCADDFNAPNRVEIIDADQMPADLMMLDIGPSTAEAFGREVSEAGTILWNGPMGVFENDRFADGTRRVGEAIASSGATTIVGGGDTVAAIERFSDPGRFTHVSTGGGASLELLEGKTLPGIAALSDR